MNHETVFRLIAFAIFFVGVGTSIYFRHKAARETGEAISRNVDGKLLMNIIRLGGQVLWLSPILYLLNPAWMAWSKTGLSEGLRWLGVGPGILCNLGIYWLFSSAATSRPPVPRAENTNLSPAAHIAGCGIRSTRWVRRSSSPLGWQPITGSSPRLACWHLSSWQFARPQRKPT